MSRRKDTNSMNNEITLDKEQTARLLNITRDYSTVSDIITARDLYNASIEQSGGAANEWARFTALGSLFRIGYILGQRAERARRSHTHTATHTGRGLSFSAVQNGGRRHE